MTYRETMLSFIKTLFIDRRGYGQNLLDFDRADLIGTKVLLGLITIAVTIYALIMPLVDWIRAKAFVAEVPAPGGHGRGLCWLSAIRAPAS
ncbi:MAG: hypothetical protein R2709_13490 [Marmoricola sp.]